MPTVARHTKPCVVGDAPYKLGVIDVAVYGNLRRAPSRVLPLQ